VKNICACVDAGERVPVSFAPVFMRLREAENK
jgi:hypothetical protein